MDPLKPGTLNVNRVLPTHELNARRNRKRAVMPHIPATPQPRTQTQVARNQIQPKPAANSSR